MLKSIQGVYREGKIELVESPANVGEETPVIVTFLETNGISLQASGINEEEANNLRASFDTFSDEWDSPEMKAYDDYDTAKARL